MRTIEYRVALLPRNRTPEQEEECLNLYGAQGWQLVGIEPSPQGQTGDKAIFMRERFISRP